MCAEERLNLYLNEKKEEFAKEIEWLK
jgi:hypothetical protein